MNTQKLNDGMKELVSLTQELRISLDSGNAEATIFPLTIRQPMLGALTLESEQATKYLNCVTTIYKALNPKAFPPIVSLGGIETAIQQTILRALNPEIREKKLFDEHLQKSTEFLRVTLSTVPHSWDIYVKVYGIGLISFPQIVSADDTLPLSPFSFFFGKVQFSPVSLEGIETIKKETNDRIARTTANDQVTEETRELSHKWIDQEFKIQKSQDPFRGQHTIAHIQVTALDLVTARELARKEVELTLDALNFYTWFIHSSDTLMRAYLPGQSASDERLAFWLMKDDYCGFSFTTEGAFVDIPVNYLHGDIAHSIGLTQLSQILAKVKRTPIEDRIVASIRFAGRAAVNRVREEAFLNYAIALESLLGDKDIHGEITFKLATRCAYLLGRNEEDRWKIKVAIGQLYGTRSKIVHEGSVEITETQLSKIASCVHTAIQVVLTKPIFQSLQTEDEFRQMFERAMLSGSIERQNNSKL